MHLSSWVHVHVHTNWPYQERNKTVARTNKKRVWKKIWSNSKNNETEIPTMAACRSIFEINFNMCVNLMGFNLFIFVPCPQTTTTATTIITIIIIAAAPQSTRKKSVLEAINPSSMLHAMKRERTIFQAWTKKITLISRCWPKQKCTRALSL